MTAAAGAGRGVGCAVRTGWSVVSLEQAGASSTADTPMHNMRDTFIGWFFLRVRLFVGTLEFLAVFTGGSRLAG